MCPLDGTAKETKTITLIGDCLIGYPDDTYYPPTLVLDGGILAEMLPSGDLLNSKDVSPNIQGLGDWRRVGKVKMTIEIDE